MFFTRRFTTIVILSLQGFLFQVNGDPYAWLENIEGEKALAWAREQNESSQRALEAHPDFGQIHRETLKILQSKDRIPRVSRRGRLWYNFWQDEEHVRGIWRRTTLEEYKQAKPAWETVLDFDRLANDEKENWVYKGVDVLEPFNDRAMIRLSRGGKDASVYREFDLKRNTFVQNGFHLKEAKSDLAWIDRDTLLVATDFGEGTLTSSGYPRTVRLWKRGQSLQNSPTLLEGEKSDVGLWTFTLQTTSGPIGFIRRSRTFYKGEYHYFKKGKTYRLPLPENIRLSGYHSGQILVQLKAQWKVNRGFLPRGALVSLPLNKLLQGSIMPQVIHVPDNRSTITSVHVTTNAILINSMTNVTSRLLRYTYNNGKWTGTSTAENFTNGVLSINNTSPYHEDYTFSFQNFLTPSTLYHVRGSKGPTHKLKQTPDRFDTSDLKITQYWVKSRDGTPVPYFLVGKRELKANGQKPTLLYAYGGFEIPMRPWYSPTVGANWLSRGGVYVLANIRGGGEFGPSWHQAALKTNRYKAYEDFIAVAEDLIRKRITSPRHLGIRGGSNGGLLTGVAFTRRPDLFNAVVCQVPLLDMKRYTQLLAGHSWIAEYGDPEIPEIWRFWEKWSPYHNLSRKQKYPKVFFTTSTKDDRVHPGHARKMVARMKELRHPVLYYENIEGGHAGAANLKQRAYTQALAYAYLLQQLK